MWHYTSLLTSETLFPYWANTLRDSCHSWSSKEKYIGKHLTEYEQPLKVCVWWTATIGFPRIFSWFKKMLRSSCRRQDASVLIHNDSRINYPKKVDWWLFVFVFHCCAKNNPKFSSLNNTWSHNSVGWKPRKLDWVLYLGFYKTKVKESARLGYYLEALEMRLILNSFRLWL